MQHTGKSTQKGQVSDRHHAGVNELCTKELHLLLQLRYVDLPENHLSGTLPSSWAGLTKASCAAYKVF